jgi:hypothetical protein
MCGTLTKQREARAVFGEEKPMDPADITLAREVAERHLNAPYEDTAHIVRQVPMYPTSAPATQIEPTLPLEIWVFDAERSDGHALTLIATRSPAGWSVVEKI